MPNYPTPPTYNEARAARKLVTMARIDPSAVAADALANALDTIRARSEYLSRCHRASPKYKGRRTNAEKRNDTPAYYCLREALRLVGLLHTYAQGTNAVQAAEAARALTLIEAATQSTGDEF